MSAIRWYGGKKYLADRIRTEMPKHTSYVEPYFGSGAVLFTSNGQGVSESVNDLNGDLINFWRVLASEEDFGRLTRILEATPYCEQVFVDCKAVLRSGTSDNVLRAAAFYVVNRQSFSANMQQFSFPGSRVPSGMNENVNAWLNAIEGLPQWHRRMKRVVITCRDAVQVIKSMDSPSTFFYCDPPYLQETRVKKSVYQHEMTFSNHMELLDTLAHIKGKFILSGYHSHLYDHAAEVAGWRLIEIPIDCKVAASQGENGERIECLWLNY